MSKMQGVDEQSCDSGFASVEPSTKASVLDQHVQCMYHACICSPLRLYIFLFLITKPLAYLCICST